MCVCTYTFLIMSLSVHLSIQLFVYLSTYLPINSVWIHIYEFFLEILLKPLRGIASRLVSRAAGEHKENRTKISFQPCSVVHVAFNMV